MSKFSQFLLTYDNDFCTKHASLNTLFSSSYVQAKLAEVSLFVQYICKISLVARLCTLCQFPISLTDSPQYYNGFSKLSYDIIVTFYKK